MSFISFCDPIEEVLDVFIRWFQQFVDGNNLFSNQIIHKILDVLSELLW